MTEARIKGVTASRDHIERMRDQVESIFHILAELSTEIAEVREQNGITVQGEEVDPPEGYQAKTFEWEAPFEGHFHRIVRSGGSRITEIKR